MKKTLSIILSLLMLFSITMGIDFSAFAGLSNSGSCGTGVSYTFDSATGELVISGNGSIDGSAFENETEIKSVVINDGVKEIGFNAFYGCYDIENVSIADSVTDIGVDAFGVCTNLKEIKLPNALKEISSSLFNACESLTGITIPNGVTKIDSGAFFYCHNLTSITIPESVKTIDWAAFMLCTGFESLVIPDSVTSIGKDAFSLCRNVVYNGKATGAPWSANAINGYVDGDFVFSDSTKTMLCSCFTSTKQATIPNTVTTIGYNAFSYCLNITNIKIPDSVTKILNGAFGECENLESIIIPNSLTNTEGFVFCGCIGLRDVCYLGTREEWKNINIEDEYDRKGLDSFVHFHPEDGHSFEVAKQTEATCLNDGKIDYICPICDYSYTDTVPVLEHRTTATVTKATPNSNGSIVTTCTDCSTQTAKKTIYSPKTVSLSATKYTYDGKAKKPVVIVKDSKGNMVGASNYDVSFSNNKAVGTASVKITFKGNYSGSITKTYSIVPKSTSVAKLTALSKGIKVAWKKQSAQTTGYQIQIATDKSFTKNVKTYTVAKNSTLSKKVTKLKGKKKYYVRIRTYKTVSNKKYYSSWSASKYITTKK